MILVNTKKIVVVGGGPSGIMAAIRAAQLNQDVTLIEKNSLLGTKLLLSGKGRCNLTNTSGPELFLARFSKNGQFLRDAFKIFFNLDLLKFFQERGLKLKSERQKRVFPVTDKSSSILSVLKKELIKNKVKIIYKTTLKDIFVQNRKIKGILSGHGTTILCERLILATGGVTYAFTGSSGEGLEISKRLGHKITGLKPGLVPFETRQKYPKNLKNLMLKNIQLKFSDGQRQIVSDIGELLFTDFGISGALVLSLSGRIVDWLDEDKQVCVEIDLKPALSKEQINGRLLREFNQDSRAKIKKVLKSMLPIAMISTFLEIAKIDSNKSVSQITQLERRNLVSLFKALRLDILRSRPIDQAMITRGGVSLKDVNPRTMESRLIKGLYFSGEMLDLDADTGGFNLQAAFSTGYLAGESASLN
ncbi:MAG: NAD(P)/FAD-dependent oxidoreductase [Candidatus Omnitrophica bacterium]|nr:NAD(P)/FAD-dependent oxidoreductase [Candidatus Omnitrophota bacterium]MBU1090793.1 NAD(P)/FAD-dependent oxidoreductase [Candidatus Omnitrophota bacterium]